MLPYVCSPLQKQNLVFSFLQELKLCGTEGDKCKEAWVKMVTWLSGVAKQPGKGIRAQCDVTKGYQKDNQYYTLTTFTKWVKQNKHACILSVFLFAIINQNGIYNISI